MNIHFVQIIFYTPTFIIITYFIFFFQNNKSKSLSLDLSNLNTASFKSLLEEVVAYDTAKQTKSELYNVCTYYFSYQLGHF